MDQFLRTELLIGKDKVQKLKESFVIVIGMGAVGSYSIEGIARAGVGHIRIVDFDTIKSSNINRQLYALHSTLGEPKVEVAKKRILDINPRCQVETLHEFVSNDTLDKLLSGEPNIVIDAIDSLNPKVQLLTACFKKGLPVISSMGAALRTDPAKICIADIFDTLNCPLAFQIRRRLRRNGVGRGITAVFSNEKVRQMRSGAIGEKEPNAYDRGRKRVTLGSLPTLTGIFGLIIANKTIEMLCDGF